MVEPGTCGEHAFSSSDAEFQADVARYNEAREAAGGESPDSCVMNRRMKRLAVLGHPVGHSRSPAMQNAALAELGLAGEWSYEAIDVAPDEFEPRVRAMPGEGFVGANVTVPHKGAALALADALSETAREIGAANTLSFADGEIRADNTDAQGLLDALPGLAGAATRALVLGAGGAARAVVWALAPRGGRGRGLEPHRAALAPPLRGARRASRSPARTRPPTS